MRHTFLRALLVLSLALPFAGRAWAADDEPPLQTVQVGPNSHYVQGLSQLTRLEWVHRRMGAADIDALANLPLLRELQCCLQYPASTGLSRLRVVTNLEVAAYLDESGCSMVTTSATKRLAICSKTASLLVKYSYSEPTPMPAMSAMWRVVVPAMPRSATQMKPASTIAS